MEWRKYAFCSIFVLGFLGALLGCIAEVKKRTGKDIKPDSTGQCLYPRSPAMGIGLAAALFTLMTQIAANALGGCICCEQGYVRPDEPPNPRISLSIACLIFSWLTCVNGTLLLLSGASINGQRIQVDNISDGCYVLKPGIFAGGAVLCVITTFLGVTYAAQAAEVRKVLKAIQRSHSSSQIVAMGPIDSSHERYYTGQAFSGVMPDQGFKKPYMEQEARGNKAYLSYQQPMEVQYGNYQVSQVASTAQPVEMQYGGYQNSQNSSIAPPPPVVEPLPQHWN